MLHSFVLNLYTFTAIYSTVISGVSSRMLGSMLGSDVTQLHAATILLVRTQKECENQRPDLQLKMSMAIGNEKEMIKFVFEDISVRFESLYFLST